MMMTVFVTSIKLHDNAKVYSVSIGGNRFYANSETDAIELGKKFVSAITEHTLEPACFSIVGL